MLQNSKCWSSKSYSVTPARYLVDTVSSCRHFFIFLINRYLQTYSRQSKNSLKWHSHKAFFPPTCATHFCHPPVPPICVPHDLKSQLLKDDFYKDKIKTKRKLQSRDHVSTHGDDNGLLTSTTITSPVLWVLIWFTF